jgi:LmbE family N-acetylglucosaminyl deacetylase
VPKHSLLCVFAHPDDENPIGPLLARSAAEGHDVHLISITSGQKGYRPHFDMAAGEALGAIREEEQRAACRALGIHEPFLLGFEDQGISSPPVAEQVAARVREIVNQTRADVLLSWGPDGLTGHIDHRMASNIAACVFQQQARLAYRPRKLYFITFPESRFLANRDPLNRRREFLTVSDEFITTEIDCRDHLAAGLRAIQCHKTQWRPERMVQVHEMYAKLFEGRVYLRLALARVPRPSLRESSIFEGLE